MVFGTSRRAAARAAARASGTEEEARAEREPVRRRRWIVHVREHTLIVPMLASATVAALTTEVNDRVARRQLTNTAVVDLQVRTDAGTGFLEPSDCLEDVISEQDELVAVLEGSYPVRTPSAMATAQEVLGKAQPRSPTAQKRADAANAAGGGWESAVVTISLVDTAAAHEERGSSPEPLAQLSARSRTSVPRNSPRPLGSATGGEHRYGPPLNTVGKQRDYLHGLLAEMHRHDSAGVPAYKQRILQDLQARSMHDTPSERPLLQPALSKRALRAQIAESQLLDRAADGLPPIAPRPHALGTAPSAAAAASPLGGSLDRARARSAHSVLVQTAAEQVEERERQLFSFQTALSKLELDALELNDREEATKAELARADAEAAQIRSETRLTPAQWQTWHEQAFANMTSRLKRAELCVSESVANNRQLRAHVDHLRKELGIFKKGRHKVDEKDAAITRDIRHLTGLLQGTMDDRQKVRSRLERLQHEYRAEGKFYAKQLARLSAEADALEAARAARVLEIEEHEDADKRKEYQRISQWRQQVRGRELRAGRLQDHLAWFQRQARQMEDMLDVTFRPEMPNGAAETIGHYQRRQAHAQSLWAKINDSEAQAAELAAEIRALTQRLADLEEAQAQHGADAAADAASGDLPGTSLDDTSADELVKSLLEQLCPVVQRTFDRLGCERDQLGEQAQLHGLCATTVPDYLDLIDRALKAKLLRARQIKALRKHLAREQAKSEGLSPRSALAAEQRAGFAAEHRETLDGFEAHYDVVQKPYDMEEEYMRLTIESSRRELQFELDRRSKNAEDD